MLTNTDLELAKLRLLGFNCYDISDDIVICMKDTLEILMIPDTVKSLSYDSVLKINAKLRDYSGSNVNLKVCGGKNLESISCLLDFVRFNTIDLSELDTSNVTDMSNMFFGCSANEIDLRSLDTYGVWIMDNMFKSSNIHKLDLSTLKVDKLCCASDIFHNCISNNIIINKEAFDRINCLNGYAYDAGNSRNIVFNIIDN